MDQKYSQKLTEKAVQ